MSNDPTRQHLLGTWKLIAAVREEIFSGTKTEFLGPNPVGYINYDVGTAQTLVGDGGSVILQNPTLTGADLAARATGG